MIPRDVFLANLELARRIAKLPGAVVECGVWRGGMIAALSEILGPERHYYLFDSFQGLPPVKEVDGPRARAWQQNTSSPNFHDNCTASEAQAAATLRRSPARNVHIFPGWFENTLPANRPAQDIALLRLDADWYDSTTICLENLYPLVVPGGLVIIDDYYTWDGCNLAIHDYFSRNRLAVPVCEHWPRVAYFNKM
jgi:hypothetical protein